MATYKSDSITDAEALARRLSDLGASVYMTVPPSGHPFLSFDFALLPIGSPSGDRWPHTPRVLELAGQIRRRFNTDEQFRKDLFGWLLVEGRVHQRFAEHHPGRVVLDGPAQALSGPLRLQPVGRS